MGVTLAAIADDGDLLALDEVLVGVAIVVNLHSLNPFIYSFIRHPRESGDPRSEEHTSELQSLMRISYAVFCLNKKTKPKPQISAHQSVIHNLTATTSLISTR